MQLLEGARCRDHEESIFFHGLATVTKEQTEWITYPLFQVSRMEAPKVLILKAAGSIPAPPWCDSLTLVFL